MIQNEQKKTILDDFYRHLGSIVINGKKLLKENDNNWQALLEENGFEDISRIYKKLFVSSDGESYRFFLKQLICETGKKLRESIEIPQYTATTDERHSLLFPSQLRESENIIQLKSKLISGSIREKREVILLLGYIIRRKESVSGEAYLNAVSILAECHDPEIVFEVTTTLAQANTPEGKKAKKILGEKIEFLQRMHELVSGYWEGAMENDPVIVLKPYEMVNLGTWMRLASDYLAGHAGEVLLNLMEKGEERKLASTIASFIFCADLRLLPVFIRILQDGPHIAKIEVIKAIAHIDDPRSLGALEKAFRHTDDELEKVILCRAMAKMGSKNAINQLHKFIETESKIEIIEEALKGLGEIETPEDAIRESVLKFLNSTDSAIVKGALRALARIGNKDDVAVIEKIADENPKMRALVNTSLQKLLAKVSLSDGGIFEVGTEKKSTIREKRKEEVNVSIFKKFSAYIFYIFSFFYFLIGKYRKSLSLIEKSILRNSQKSRTLYFRAFVLSKAGEYEKSVQAYRHSLNFDSFYIVKHPSEANRMILSYLKECRRLDEMGSPSGEILALLEQLEEVDISKCDPNLKIEVVRMTDYLKYIRKSGKEEEGRA